MKRKYTQLWQYFNHQSGKASQWHMDGAIGVEIGPVRVPRWQDLTDYGDGAMRTAWYDFETERLRSGGWPAIIVTQNIPGGGSVRLYEAWYNTNNELHRDSGPAAVKGHVGDGPWSETYHNGRFIDRVTPVLTLHDGRARWHHVSRNYRDVLPLAAG